LAPVLTIPFVKYSRRPYSTAPGTVSHVKDAVVNAVIPTWAFVGTVPRAMVGPKAGFVADGGTLKYSQRVSVFERTPPFVAVPCQQAAPSVEGRLVSKKKFWAPAVPSVGVMGPALPAAVAPVRA